ncbi:MAG: DUF6465 family protein [Clostridiales bacterium]|jgi:hypothetical protein|nr:DUF6465 family protein [Clostridiales bacterium]
MALTQNIYFEWEDKKIDQKKLIDTAKETWKNEGNKVTALKTLELYCKPAEGRCYYVFNGNSKGYFSI